MTSNPVLPTTAPPQAVKALMATPDLCAMRTMSQALDSLGVGVCVFNDDAAALLWNRTFLHFFPEHAGHIHVGEPYAANLRRFYLARLDAEELGSIDRYIEEGLRRHAEQQHPYSFDHRGMRVRVSAARLPGIGSVRLWRSGDVQLAGSEEDTLRLPGSSEGALSGLRLFEHVADGIMMTDLRDRIVWANQPFVAMYGFDSEAAATGLRFEDVYRQAWAQTTASHTAGQNEAQALFERGLDLFAEHLRFAGAPFELPLPDDRWVRVIAQHSPDGQGFFAHVDITMLKRQQHHLREAEQRARESERQLQQKSALLEATLDRMEQGLAMVNADGIVEVCNRRAMELLGLPKALMASRPHVSEVFAYQCAQGEFDEVPPDLLQMMRTGSMSEPQLYDRRRADGRIIEIQSVPIQGGGMVRTYQDISERRRNEERIRHLARHDGLTGLANRSFFVEQLTQATQARSGDAFAVHFIDLDNFKPINDRLGHAIGDQVLALIALRMRQAAGARDVIGRMGGDEFAVLQSGMADVTQAVALAQRFLAAVREPMRIEGHGLQLGASIGVALYPTSGQEADQLLRSADAAMYVAKAAGGDRVRVSPT
ncbi:PAS-domain containing protein [Variovorax ginsengisoli]|uniref:Diguanylate cyclase (GGDEF)-like protein n=1 Tax=Variovorax ginsengisoli TaxID=363844 RepID=A0ABT9S7W2_9BURK|nr:GGDEF domain-containing protein [Variovorax ginsengisoli]MDP9900435.1 diguanylate cyclase (GGDEF)-like protein [Variovorax ginsengisoli]